MLWGFDNKIKEFKNLAAAGQLGQSYVFFGDSQIGKFAFAKALAVFLETGEFGETSKTLLDYQEIQPDEEKGSIALETVNQVKGFLFERPFASLRRTAIINESDKLTPEAQAALLKIVEEPPADGLIILIAPDPSVLLPALASRCQRVYFPRLAKKEIEEILIKEYSIKPETAQSAAIKSFGRLGRALVLVGYNDKGGEKDYFEEKILALWERMPIGASKLAWLLGRATSAKRFNVNVNLQQRAAEQYLTNN